MPNTNSQTDVQKKLKKYKISYQRLASDKKFLTDLDFSVHQANKLILRKHSKQTVDYLIAHHFELKKHFTNEDLIRMGARYRGSDKIKAAYDALTELQNLGLTKQDVVKLASNLHGDKNIKVAQSCFNEMKRQGFTKEQIVEMVSFEGGAANLLAVKTHFSLLTEFGFNTDQIQRAVSYRYGGKHLEAIAQALAELKRLKFNAEQILSLITANRGFHRIHAIKQNFAEIERLALSPEQIIALNNQRQNLSLFFHDLHQTVFNRLSPEEYYSLLRQGLGGRTRIILTLGLTPAHEFYDILVNGNFNHYLLEEYWRHQDDERMRNQMPSGNETIEPRLQQDESDVQAQEQTLPQLQTMDEAMSIGGAISPQETDPFTPLSWPCFPAVSNLASQECSSFFATGDGLFGGDDDTQHPNLRINTSPVEGAYYRAVSNFTSSPLASPTTSSNWSYFPASPGTLQEVEPIQETPSFAPIFSDSFPSFGLFSDDGFSLPSLSSDNFYPETFGANVGFDFDEDSSVPNGMMDALPQSSPASAMNAFGLFKGKRPRDEQSALYIRDERATKESRPADYFSPGT